MLDTLLSRLKEDIAIDGTTGSSIDTVWEYAETVSKQIAQQSGLSISPKIDAPYKSFLWNYLKQEPELEFYEEQGKSASLINDVTMEEHVDHAQIYQDPKQAQDGVSVETGPIEDGGKLVESPRLDAGLMDYFEEVYQHETDSRTYRGSKRKSAPTKRAAAPKGKKKKPTKKKKNVASGHSDSDFAMDSDSDSEFEESSASEVSSEDYSEQEDEPEEEYETGDVIKNFAHERKPASKSSNPKRVQEQEQNDNLGLKAIEDVADLSYEQAQEQYGSRLRILASARLQEEQLYIGVPPNANLSPTLHTVLKEIIKTRTKGLYQASITRLLKFDSRSTGHYVKSLEEKGAITRSGVSINSMYTNICIHARFSLESSTVDMNTVGEDENKNEVPYNVNGHGKAFSQKTLLYAMVDLAKSTSNGMILAQDILHGLGFNSTRFTVRKWFNRTIDDICTKGYFEKANIRLNGTKGHRCLRLLKFPEDYNQAQYDQLTSEIPLTELVFPIKIKNTKNCDIPIHHLLCDVPFESQCLDVLNAAGNYGATQKDISVALNIDEMRMLTKALEKFVDLKKGQGFEQFGLVRYLEFEGRLRRYRYFTLASSIKVNENRDYASPPLPDIELDESKFYERDIFIDLPHRLKDFQAYRKMIKLVGHKNVSFMDPALQLSKTGKNAWVPKPLYNRDGTVRKKSRYILNKEKEMRALAAKSARANNPSNESDPNTASTEDAAALPVHSFFAPSNKPSTKPRRRKKEVSPLPPSSDPVPAPILIGPVLACPAVAKENHIRRKPNRNPKANPSTLDEPATKKRKPNIPVEESSSTPENNRVTRSGRPISSDETTQSDSFTENIAVSQEEEEVVPPPESTPEAAEIAVLEPEAAEIAVLEPEAAEIAVLEPEAAEIAVLVPEAESNSSASRNLPLNSTSNSSESTDASAPTTAKPTHKTSSSYLIASKVPASRIPKSRTIADYFSRTPGKSKVTKQVRFADSTSTPDAEPSVPTNVENAPVDPPDNDAAIVESDNDVVIQEPVSQPENEATVEEAVVDRKEMELPDEQPENEATVEEAVVDRKEMESSDEQPENEETVVHPKETESCDEQPSTERNEERHVMEIDDEPMDENESHVASTDSALDEQAEQTQQDELSTPSNVPQESASKFRFSHGKRRKVVNSYLEARIKVFYEYLEEVKIVEMGKTFRIEFSKRASQHKDNSKHSIDNKTLWATALELEKRGQAKTKIVICPVLHGNIQQRKIAFHRDMDENSPEFKDFTNYIKERRSISQIRRLPKQVEEVEEPVIRLSEQVENMQHEAKTLLINGQTKEARRLEHRSNELSKNLQTFGRIYHTNIQRYWMIEAIQFGWISASMMRAKIFHKFLHGLLETDVEGVNQAERTITLAAIYNNLTLHLICQVIGIFRPTPLIIQYSKDGSYNHTKLSELPADLKEAVCDGNTKFLRRLRSLINPLEYTKVLTAQYTEIRDGDNFKITKYVHLAPCYKLEERIPIIDRKQPGEPVFREHVIKDMDDLSNFWVDLRFISTYKGPQIDCVPDPTNVHEKELRRTIQSVPNWSTKSVFTRSQRMLLNEKVDKKNRTTLVGNQPEMKEMATLMNVPYEAIRGYYQRVQNALDRRARFTKEEKLQRLLLCTKRRRSAKFSKFDIYHGRRVLSANSDHAFDTTKRKLSIPKKAGECAVKKRPKGEMLYMDDLRDIPVIQDDSSLALKRARRKRTIWTRQDDEVLLYAYAILKHRSRSNGHKFWWAPVTQVFSDKNPGTGRHRISRLLLHPTASEKYESHLIMWDIFYKEGLENGDIKDENPLDNVHVDILSYIAYFIQRLQNIDENPVELVLPNSITKAHEQFQFIYNEVNNVLMEDAFHDNITLVQKLQTLYQTPFTVRKYTDSVYDESESSFAIESDPTKRLCSILKMYALITLMTPSESFDPFYAFQVLGTFSTHLKSSVFERMRTDKTLVLVSGDRPIPGTRLTLSAKFMKDMRGHLPQNLLLQAKEYEKFLSKQTEKFKFSPTHISSGMMACLLNSLSNNQISLSLSNLNMQMKRIQDAGFKLRVIGSIFTHIEVDIQKINQETDQTTTHARSLTNIFSKVLDTTEYQEELSKFLDSQGENEGSLIQSVIDTLYAQGEIGLTLYQLKSHLNGSYTDQDILMTIHKLCYNNPALVCRVGFEAVRYVHLQFVDSWCINNKNMVANEPSVEGKEEMMKASKGLFQPNTVRQDFLLPSLWVDMNGNVTKLVLDGCKEAIVDLVLRKPGISETDIYRHVNTGLSKREVRELLDMLIEQQALRQIQLQFVPQQSKYDVSVFSKNKLARCAKSNSIEKYTQSCFWVTPHTYSSL